jgi:prepilin-type N-terminal cleavage/methylation domain-containing protein
MALHSRSGLSLAEVLVVLVVSSLVLSITLPMAGRAISTNLSMSSRGMDVQSLAIQETVFRRLLRASIQPEKPMVATVVPSLVTGSPKEIELTVAPEQPAGCISAARVQKIRLVIRASDEGQILECVSEDRATIISWFPAAQEVAFSFSSNGQRWERSWPVGSDNNWTVGAISPPLVRLMVESEDRPLIWIERAGYSSQLELEPFADLFGSAPQPTPPNAPP